ncbi:tryptophan halogenase family protein [Cellvibrio sp. pealriver]|uniref:tryptophan halogenase family protein n=1 Tax=Cellvibrio sp. pealriver TaxID=1622269 RepID=UPI00066FEA40|nr:tryptophan halogenase family protein [Cellvibrio sp. pealriver]
MQHTNIESILIVGGGTAGWMSAAALAKILGREKVKIRLVESEDIGTVGVGEATIPQIQRFNIMLGLDDNDFVKKTQATFKLGIQFVNWRKQGHSYIHAFGDVGIDVDAIPFYHYWLKLNHTNPDADIGEYCLNTSAALNRKFMRPINNPNSPLSNIPYAYHFDAGLYAKFLRQYAENLGVERIEATIDQVNLRDSDGFVESVTLKNGKQLAADLFIDCSGFKGLVIEEALKTGYEDWSHWLPCDRAWAVPCASNKAPTSYTRSTAHSAGWQWRIPLQHRIGNGHVYSSKFMDDQEAKNILLSNLDGEVLAAPKQLRFTTGKRKQFWNKNCVAVGLSSGFMEPLESTSIHLIQSSLAKLISLFPTKDFNQANIAEYNRQTHFEFEKIRDFLILHYHVTERDDSDFWNYCRTMEIPDSLAQKISLFRSTGKIFRESYEMFSELSWFEVMQGQGLMPSSYHPLTDLTDDAVLHERMSKIRQAIKTSVDLMPFHEDFIAQHCAANKM